MRPRHLTYEAPVVVQFKPGIYWFNVYQKDWIPGILLSHPDISGDAKQRVATVVLPNLGAVPVPLHRTAIIRRVV